MTLHGKARILLAAEGVMVLGDVLAHDEERRARRAQAQAAEHVHRVGARAAVVIRQRDHAKAAVVGLGLRARRHVGANLRIVEDDVQQGVFARIQRVRAVGERQARGAQREGRVLQALRPAQRVQRGGVRLLLRKGGGQLL